MGTSLTNICSQTKRNALCIIFTCSVESVASVLLSPLHCTTTYIPRLSTMNTLWRSRRCECNVDVFVINILIPREPQFFLKWPNLMFWGNLEPTARDVPYWTFHGSVTFWPWWREVVLCCSMALSQLVAGPFRWSNRHFSDGENSSMDRFLRIHVCRSVLLD